VICLTLKHYAEWLACRQPGKRFVHIPIGMYNAPEVLEEPAAPELLFFATLAPFKGLDLLLEAFRVLRLSMPELRLTIAGAEHPRFPGYAASMQQRYAGLGGVHWLGYVPEANVRDVFRQCQVVVLPYTAATGSSSVLYQAMVWGRPIVASGLPELRSAVDEAGLRAEFFHSGDVAGLAEALEHLLHSPERRRRQVQWNSRAMNRHRLDATGRAYLHAFNLALNMRSTPSRIRVPPEMTAESVG
jgi:glycosyltransferase involved in cell wall biosynthesis